MADRPADLGFLSLPAAVQRELIRVHESPTDQVLLRVQALNAREARGIAEAKECRWCRGPVVMQCRVGTPFCCGLCEVAAAEAERVAP